MEFLNSRSQILKKLTGTYKNAPSFALSAESGRYVVFSDHHRGNRGPSDFFKRSEKAYNAALGYYLERGYTLILLGDVEEFWEHHPRHVIRSYPLTYALEKEFHDAGKLIKIRGNHDNLWKHPHNIKKFLDQVFPGVRVYEAVRLERRNKNGQLKLEVFLTHGHQGTLLNDTLDWFGMFWLRFLAGRILSFFKHKYQTPATKFSLREQQDKTMFDWAGIINEATSHEVLFIAGHTHHPIFMSRSSIAQIREQIQILKEDPTKENLKKAARLRSRLEYLQADVGLNLDLIDRKSHYYNTGSCSFFDGSITGIELTRKKISLVKWSDVSHRAERRILGSEKFSEID